MVKTENPEMVVEGSGSRALDKKKKKRKKKTSVPLSAPDSERKEKMRRVKKEQTNEDEGDKKEKGKKHSPDHKKEENGGSGGDLRDEGKEVQSAPEEDNEEKRGSRELLEESGGKGKKVHFADEKADNEEKQQKKHSAAEKEEEIGGSGGDFDKSGKEKEKPLSAAEVEEPKGTTKSKPEVAFSQKPPLAETSAVESLKPWQRKWSEKDEVTILKAIIKYMKAKDAKIADVDMKNMVESIIGSYQFQFVPETKQLRDKIWKLKRKYSKNLQRADRSNMVRHQRRVFKLSKKIWADLKINQEVVRGRRNTTRLRQIELCQKELDRRVEETRLKLERLIGSSGSC